MCPLFQPLDSDAAASTFTIVWPAVNRTFSFCLVLSPQVESALIRWLCDSKQVTAEDEDSNLSPWNMACAIFQLLEISRSWQSSFSVNRSFCQICQKCTREKDSAKKLPLTGVEPLTLGLTVLLTSCLSCLTPVLDPISWKTETLMILI